MLAHIDTLILIGLLAVAVWTDHSQHRIPNVLVLITLIAGLLLQSVLHGFDGFSTALAGLAAGVLVFLIPYAKGGMAAGDVKFIGAIGTFLGPTTVLLAGGMALVIGALVGGAAITIQQLRAGGVANVAAEKVLTSKFPFAGAIAVGCVGALMIRGTL